MTEDRVKFYSLNDLGIGFHRKRIESVLDEDIPKFLNNINDVLEIINIGLFFENKIKFDNWTELKVSEYINKLNNYQKLIGKFCSMISSDTIYQLLEDTLHIYTSDFWHMITKYKVYERIDSSVFEELFKSKKFRITDVLQEEKIVKKYGERIVNFFNYNEYAIKTVFIHFLEDRSESNKYYMPSGLNIEELTNKYIDWSGADANYLQLIYQSPPTFPVSDRTKLKARRKYEYMCEELTKSGVVIKYGVKISFGPYDDFANVRFEDRDLICEYSSNWIKDNLDYSTLLNNFIYMFNFVDLQFRCSFILKNNQMGTLERVIKTKGKMHYVIGTVFNQLQMLALAQMKAYYEQLVKNGIYLEDIIKWFFETYLSEEFAIKGFCFNKPSIESTYMEKCRTIIAEIDSVLQQFKLWCEDGKIDRELFEFSSTPILINQVPSCVTNKYIYATEKAENIMFALFSDQSILTFFDEHHNDGDCFYDIIMKNTIAETQIKRYQQLAIEELKKYNIIDVQNGIIIPNHNKMWILKELYNNSTISNSYFERLKDDINQFYEQEIIEYGSSLLSKEEMNYYNFIMNKREFSNGLDVRNRYAHGNQNNNESQNEEDYYILLRILILIVIKINEEACLSKK